MAKKGYSFFHFHVMTSSIFHQIMIKLRSRMRLFVHFLGIILIWNFFSSGNFSAIDRTNNDGIYMFPDFLQTRLFVTSFKFTLTFESDQTTELQRSLFLLDLTQVDLMNFRLEYVRPRSGWAAERFGRKNEEWWSATGPEMTFGGK